MIGKKCRKTDDAVILKLSAEGKSQRYIAKQLKCSKTAILKRLRKLLPTRGHHRENQTVTNEIPRPKYSKDSRYLRKIGTDEIFIWTRYIAVRLDMEEVRWTGKKFVMVTREPLQTLNDLGGF